MGRQSYAWDVYPIQILRGIFQEIRGENSDDCSMVHETYVWYNSVELCSFVTEAFDPGSKLAEVASGRWTDGIEELQDDPAGRFRIDRNIELPE